jgi:hypothetical protein
MKEPKLLRHIIILLMLALSYDAAKAQVEVKGTVSDRTMGSGLQGVSVMSTSGAGVISDSVGHYSLFMSEKDSIYFSYLGKRTPKIPIQDIPSVLHYDVVLEVDVEALPPVFVSANNYHEDSLEHRKEFANIFDFEGGGPMSNLSTRGRGMGAGLDLDFFSKKTVTHSRESVQRYFEEDERQRYVDFKFSKLLIKKITGLESPVLDTFMKEYRPSYDYVKSFTSDYELDKYIKDSYSFFIEAWKEDHRDFKVPTPPVTPTSDDTAVDQVPGR